MVISKLERAYFKNFDDAFLCVLDLSGNACERERKICGMRITDNHFLFCN